jgi:sugar-specific transcriptional regulator TrmB
MQNQILAELGLSPNEIKIYEALLTYGGSGVSTISLRSKIHRRNAYDTINRLLEKGLVYEVQGQGELVYEPVEPSKLMEMAQEKVHKLEEALPGMMRVFHAKKTPERSYIYKGIEGLKNYMRDTLTVGEDIYVFGGKGAWFDPRLKTYMQTYFEEAKRRGIKSHVLFDQEAAERSPDMPKRFHRSKTLPKQYSTQSAIDVFGDHIVTFSQLNGPEWTEDVTIFVTISPKLAEAYRTWWKMIWDLLPEPKRAKR